MEKFDGVVTLWGTTDSNPNDNTRIELDRNEDQGNWQISLEDGPFSGYPTINLDRKRLEELHQILEQELYPEKFQRHYKPVENSEKAYRDLYNETGLA